MQNSKLARKRGQTMVEYIIIVVIIAISAIAIFGVFGDTIRQKLSGAVNELGGDESAASEAVSTQSEDWLKELEPEGTNSKAHSLKSVIPSMPSKVQRSCIKSANYTCTEHMHRARCRNQDQFSSTRKSKCLMCQHTQQFMELTHVA